MDWFAGVAEEELLYYTGVGNDVDSLWAVIGSFVPPPPRPPYLPEESIATDGLTTCDLCSWAWRNDRHSFSLDGTLGESYIFQSIRIFHRLLFPFKRYAVWFRRVLQAVRKIIVFISVPAFCLTQLFFKYFDFASKCFNWSALSRFERDSLSGTSRSAIEMGCFISEAVTTCVIYYALSVFLVITSARSSQRWRVVVSNEPRICPHQNRIILRIHTRLCLQCVYSSNSFSSLVRASGFGHIPLE